MTTGTGAAPIRLEPVFQDYLWGGQQLKDWFPQAAEMERVAEAWVLSSHRDGSSVVESGPDRGMAFSDYLKKYGKQIWGTRGERFAQFPILIKLIDARDNLSIQVHPDDAFARRLEGEGEYGKTEMWYILDHQPGAFLYYGFSKEISQEEFVRRVEDHTLPQVLNRVPVSKGDCFFIPAGTVHAIGKGILIGEIQQNSNTTYRLYDYGRVSADGKLRELHIEKGIQVSKLCPPQHPVEKLSRLQCREFETELIQVKGRLALPVGEETFQSLLCTEGEAVLKRGEEELPIRRFSSLFLPAGCGECVLEGKAQILRTQIGQAE